MSDDIRVEFVTGADDDVDPAELEELTQSLREEILQVREVESVEQPSAGPAPDGTRAFDVAAIGALIVGAGPGIEVVAKVLTVIRGWLAGRPAAPSLTFTVNDKSIVLTPTAEQQEALVKEFVAALHAR